MFVVDFVSPRNLDKLARSLGKAMPAGCDRAWRNLAFFNQLRPARYRLQASSMHECLPGEPPVRQCDTVQFRGLSRLKGGHFDFCIDAFLTQGCAVSRAKTSFALTHVADERVITRNLLGATAMAVSDLDMEQADPLHTLVGLTKTKLSDAHEAPDVIRAGPNLDEPDGDDLRF